MTQFLFVQVRVGSVKRAKGGQALNVSNVHIHKDFNKTNLNDDIALLTLDKFIDSSDTLVRPAQLPGACLGVVGTQGTVAGWGRTENSTGMSTRRLRQLEGVKVWTAQKCKTALKKTP